MLLIVLRKSSAHTLYTFLVSESVLASLTYCVALSIAACASFSIALEYRLIASTGSKVEISDGAMDSIVDMQRPGLRAILHIGWKTWVDREEKMEVNESTGLGSDEGDGKGEERGDG